MSQELENTTSLQLEVARELAKVRRPFRYVKRRTSGLLSNLEIIYSEELESGRQHPHPEKNAGFS